MSTSFPYWTRRNALRRPDPNLRDVQILAANLDLVLLVVPIDRGLNARMLERFAVMAFDSGARPVVVLTKADGTNDATGTGNSNRTGPYPASTS
jgi:ribosome biogenesis GTPase